jgi:ubiquitin thioesterase ZRANB1
MFGYLLEIEDLPPATQEQLYSEVLDRDAQKELESEADIINWSEEVVYFAFSSS